MNIKNNMDVIYLRELIKVLFVSIFLVVTSCSSGESGEPEQTSEPLISTDSLGNWYHVPGCDFRQETARLSINDNSLYSISYTYTDGVELFNQSLYDIKVLSHYTNSSGELSIEYLGNQNSISKGGDDLWTYGRLVIGSSQLTVDSVCGTFIRAGTELTSGAYDRLRSESYAVRSVYLDQFNNALYELEFDVKRIGLDGGGLWCSGWNHLFANYLYYSTRQYSELRNKYIILDLPVDWSDSIFDELKELDYLMSTGPNPLGAYDCRTDAHINANYSAVDQNYSILYE